MRYLILILIASGFLMCCERNHIGGIDIIGEWQAIASSGDPSLIFEFLENDTLWIHKTDIDQSFPIYYKLQWGSKIEIEYLDQREKYDVLIHSNDEIEIIGFAISNIPEEMNTKLIRL